MNTEYSEQAQALPVQSQAALIEAQIANLRTFFQTQTTLLLEFRRQQLHKLRDVIIAREQEILAALQKDLNKSKTEAFMTEIALVLEEINYMLKHLRKLSQAKRRCPGLSQLPGKLRLQYEPYGVVLLLSPWNYPFQLTLAPLIAALAAGNCVLVKPSAYSPATSTLLKSICEEAFEPGLVAVIEGGREANTALLEQRFDYIFFTGSPAVGATVMSAAARHLTPVTLELGGKSPCVVDSSANIKKTAKRILFGKLSNAGQTCVAPDYVLVEKNVKEKLVKELLKGLARALPNQEYMASSFGRIVQAKHFARLLSLAQDQRLLYAKNAEKLLPEGADSSAPVLANEASLQIVPALVDEPAWSSPIMQEEIFGPLLPIISWDDTGTLLRELAQREKPLALYIFSKDKAFINKTLQNVSSGGVCLNDTLLHMASSKAPFGGVGNSGMGSYHGAAGFYTFSHERTVLHKSWLGDIALRHHPFKERSFRWLKRLMG